MRIFIFLVAVFSGICSAESIYFDGPADHDSIIAFQDFDAAVTYGSGSSVDCEGAQHESTGRCTFTLDGFPVDAVGVHLLVKTKSWAKTASTSNRCQIDARVVKTGVTLNHFIHSEINGRPEYQNRIVKYTAIYSKLRSDGTLVIDVARGSQGQCQTSLVFYFEGYRSGAGDGVAVVKEFFQ